MNTQAHDRRRQTCRPMRQPTRRETDPNALVAGIWQWIHEVSELGQPRFGELGVLLNSLRQAVMAASNERGLADAHNHRLVDQLELLIARLDHGSEHFRSWQDACLQFAQIWNSHQKC